MKKISSFSYSQFVNSHLTRFFCRSIQPQNRHFETVGEKIVILPAVSFYSSFARVIKKVNESHSF